jgi:hypothetical protein
MDAKYLTRIACDANRDKLSLIFEQLENLAKLGDFSAYIEAKHLDDNKINVLLSSGYRVKPEFDTWVDVILCNISGYTISWRWC